MSLGDPFQTTYEGSRQALGSYGQALGQIAGDYRQTKEKQAQGQATQNMLKQFGILTDKEKPYSMDEIKDFAKKKFGTDININSTMPEDKQVETAQRLLDSMGIKLPKRTTPEIDLDRAAKMGMTYKPDAFGGEATFAPKKQEPTIEESAMRFARASQLAKEQLPEGTQATETSGGKIGFKGPSSTQEKASINKERASKILEGIKSNSKSFVPDLVTGFGNPDLRAEIQTQAIEKGINLQDPILQWKGAVRLASSLNGPAQVRLQQVLSYADKSIPQMRELSDTFKRFDFTPANEVELKAAMTSTAVSPELRDAATKFMVQYTTMRTDLAQVFSGGYAPTEDAFKLADQSLSKLWGAGQMNAGLDQLQIDLGFKKAALQEVQQTSPIGMSDMGSQVTKQAGLGGGFKSGEVREKNGKKYQRNESGQWMPL